MPNGGGIKGTARTGILTRLHTVHHDEATHSSWKGLHVADARRLRQLQPVQVWPLLERNRDALPNLPHPIDVYLCEHHRASVLRSRHYRAPRVDNGAVSPRLVLGVRVSRGWRRHHVALCPNRKRGERGFCACFVNGWENVSRIRLSMLPRQTQRFNADNRTCGLTGRRSQNCRTKARDRSRK